MCEGYVDIFLQDSLYVGHEIMEEKSRCYMLIYFISFKVHNRRPFT